MSTTHCLGFSRIGPHREMKQAVEQYWKGDITKEVLIQQGKLLRAKTWQLQADAELDYITVGDFSWYDHVLDMSMMLGVIPSRFIDTENNVNLDTLFRMARGRAPTGKDAPACEMTKWFDTNYHYIVPEFSNNQKFELRPDKLLEEINEAKQLGYKVKPVVLGPLSFLWLGKLKGDSGNKCDLIHGLIQAYRALLLLLAEHNIEWVQIDEPILVLDLPVEWQALFEKTYNLLQNIPIKKLLTTYFGGLEDNLRFVCELPVDGLHIDVIKKPEQLALVADALSDYKILSVGIIDGRNIWRADLNQTLNTLEKIQQKLDDRLWVSSSCSLLHVPVDLDLEQKLDTEIKSWLAFGKQKIHEIALLGKALTKGRASIDAELKENEQVMQQKQHSTKINHPDVKERVKSIKPYMVERAHSYKTRAASQKAVLGLPLFPTTTIGSFPQTKSIRQIRRDFKSDKISSENYEKQIKAEIDHVIEKQTAIGLDVLVHGEAERNDMVEYFGEQLEGFAFTQNGWVQSYGSRCVKPPIIYGDVYRAHPMTVEWITYAQSKTQQCVKGMLTGPVTILCWSFPRNDQSRELTATQIAFALRDEVVDLEKAGIRIIQIDEPAFREGLPLRSAEQDAYLKWAVKVFRLASCGVKDETQIHTHMCYSEFNDLIASIADLDADVITIESSRSQMELLEAFENFEYPNEIGPGVYDIHSPIVPTTESIVSLLHKAMQYIPGNRLWVNPDCGLKTRDWPEVEESLRNMVAAAKQLRTTL